MHPLKSCPSEKKQESYAKLKKTPKSRSYLQGGRKVLPPPLTKNAMVTERDPQTCGTRSVTIALLASGSSLEI
jgi:hypothetical protein